MLILDLFCGAGMVADGLIAAGWQPVGVDIEPQPHYPGPFLQMDVLGLDERFLRMFPAIWASPPCLRETVMASAPGAKGDVHPELIGPTRALIAHLGIPYVIENVQNTKRLIDPVTLCGSMFGLSVPDGPQIYHLQRHRKFETNWGLEAPGVCRHQKPVVGVYGGHARIRAASAGGRGTKEGWTRSGAEIMREAMGVDRYLTTAEVSQGIPPAYARYVGDSLRRYVEIQNHRKVAT